MKNVIITGASGLVATELTHLLLDAEESYRIYAVSTHPEKLCERYKDVDNVVCLSLDELFIQSGKEIDAVIHCAFARSKDPQDLAKSLLFTSDLLRIVKLIRPKVFVNISSQSVYGQVAPPLWTEQTPPAPDYLYALGKFATEEMSAMALEGTGIKYTNIRLSSVGENARFLNIFVKNALTGQPINIQGGRQLCSFVDVRDVASGLKKVIEIAPHLESLQKVYNLGSGKTRTIKELAEDTKRLVEQEKGINVALNVIPADIHLEVGMDISLFCKEFDWSPSFDYDDMIKSFILLNDSNLYCLEEGDLPVSFKIVNTERTILRR